MARFSPGLHAEDRLVTKLEGFGCVISRSELVNHENRVDFTLLQLPESSKLLPEPLGVQVTLRIGDREKRAQFLDRVMKNPYAPRNIYIELAPDLDLEKGGAFLVLVAITNFLSNSRFKDVKVIGAQIKADLTYEFQNIVAAANIPPARSRSAALPPNYLSGIVDYYDSIKRFGFIEAATGTKYFFYIGCVRTNLASDLLLLGTYTAPTNNEDRIEVAFLDVGMTSGKTHPQAKDVYRINH